MSNSQQQSTNSNNNHPQIPVNNALDDYVNDPSMPSFANFHIDPQSSYLPGNAYVDPNTQFYSNLYNDDDDDDIPSDIENELNAQEMLGNDQSNYNYEDESIFSDAVQNAFANYENEYSQYWNFNKPNWNNFTDEEQEEIFDQMDECMLFMPEEYPIDQMPIHSIERPLGSQLNPDATEFRPSWSTTPASTESDSRIVTSSVVGEQEGQQNS